MGGGKEHIPYDDTSGRMIVHLLDCLPLIPGIYNSPFFIGIL